MYIVKFQLKLADFKFVLARVRTDERVCHNTFHLPLFAVIGSLILVLSFKLFQLYKGEIV